MRKTIIVNQAPHGIGPILRAAEMTQDLWHMLAKEGKNCEMVFTEPDKPFIKKILEKETFANDRALEHIWLAPEYGEIVNAFGFGSPDYKDRLENIALNRSNLETRLNGLLGKGMEAYNLVNPKKTMKVEYSDILCEVSHNPIVRTTKHDTSHDDNYPMFYTTIGLFSEMLENAADVMPRYKDAELRKIIRSCINEAEKVEMSQEILMIAEPSAMTYKERNMEKWECTIPPFIRPPSGSTEEIGEGVYLNISGIKSVQEQMVALAKPFLEAGYAVYYPPSYKEGIEGGIEKAPVENGISIFSNPGIITAVGRLGWSSVWEPNMNGSPFITYEYSDKEDPEMHHNVRTLEKFGLGLVMKAGDDPLEVMETALALRPRIKEYYDRLRNKYGTLDGVNYAANLVYKRLKDI
ncbi:MAG: hypothetical protein ABIB71_03345 [Candidatus Woesearchaeota archaeon]